MRGHLRRERADRRRAVNGADSKRTEMLPMGRDSEEGRGCLLESLQMSGLL